jgi:hypothetical protein
MFLSQLTIKNFRQFGADVAFAADKHRDQRRKDAAASPYINKSTSFGKAGRCSLRHLSRCHALDFCDC